MTTKAEAALSLYTFGTHGDLPALLDRHHTAIAVAPRPMTIREFEDMLSDIIDQMEDGAGMSVIEAAEKDGIDLGREEIRDDLGYWRRGALDEIGHLEKALSGEGREGSPNFPEAVKAVANLKRMIERVQEL